MTAGMENQLDAQRCKPAEEALCECLRRAKSAVTDSCYRNHPRGSAQSAPARVQPPRLTQILSSSGFHSYNAHTTCTGCSAALLSPRVSARWRCIARSVCFDLFFIPTEEALRIAEDFLLRAAEENDEDFATVVLGAGNEAFSAFDGEAAFEAVEVGEDSMEQRGRVF